MSDLERLREHAKGGPGLFAVREIRLALGIIDDQADTITRLHGERDELRAEIERLRCESSDMVMLVGMLSRQLRKHDPDSKTVLKAMGYLNRKGLMPSPLRAALEDRDE